jgi:hypothetical protein
MERSPDWVPDAIEPIIGYRLWRYRLGRRGAQLRSIAAVHPLGRRGAWHGAGSKWVVASCQQHGTDPRHLAPIEDCTCGFYAFNSIFPLLEWGFAMEKVERQQLGESDRGFVLGRVQLAGKVIAHDYGYRAERARILELIPFRGTEGSIRDLAARLGVAVGPPVTPMLDPANYLPMGPGFFRPPPPKSPSSIRKRVKEWVRHEAA